MTLQEASPEELLYLQLWEKWQDHIVENGDKSQREREAQLLTAHYKNYGLKPPTEKSPLSLMFSSFIGGGGTDSTRAGRLLTERRRGGFIV